MNFRYYAWAYAGLLSLSAAISAATPQASWHQVHAFRVGGEGGWDYLTHEEAGHRLFVPRSSHVMILDDQTGKLLGDIADTPGVHGVALDSAHHRGFTSNGGDNTVTMFDLKTLAPLSRIPVGSRPDAILYDEASQRVFTCNGGSHDLTVLDAATGKVVGTVTLEGRPEEGVADGKGHLYVNLEDKSAITAVDTKTLKILHVWPLQPGEGPTGLAMDRQNRRLFSVCDNQFMVVMDADTGHIVATPAIGHGPDGCGFDPKLKIAFSSNGQDGTLTLIHEDSPMRFSPAGVVTTQPGARTMALDPKRHQVYLAAARYQAPPTASTPPTAPRRRPAMEPGSFTILVIGR